jgi:hypothetical protein
MTPQEATNHLFQAARTGNVSDAKAALAAGADPNAKDEWPRTPLHWAAENGHTDLARLLIENRADPNAKDKWQRTPLHWAAGGGHTDLTRLLIDKGADPNARDDHQRTPLHQAAKNGYTDLARLLIEKGADPNARDDQQLTPLHFAAANGHTKLANLLATAKRWHGYVKPLLDVHRKLDATQLVDQAGRPTEALRNLLPNDLFADLARPDFYRQGMDGLVLVFPHLPEAVQASIDLTEYRRAKVLEANAAAGPDGAVERYVRPRGALSSEVNR